MAPAKEEKDKNVSSAGHRFGQLIGDWWEEAVALPLLEEVANRLALHLDCRFKQRTCRGDKILWRDVDGNDVDYDFVLELNGSPEKNGAPVGFIETFWRRGSRHSKDKARDDSGKLLPMRNTYPTARFLGILALGDFTAPAREYVSSRAINLFYVPKEKAIQAFRKVGLEIDYVDDLSEPEKLRMVQKFEVGFSKKERTAVGQALREIVGASAFKSYQDNISAALSALPQQISIGQSSHANPIVFSSVREATKFLQKPEFRAEIGAVTYRYQVEYSDGTDFEREVGSLDKLRELHLQLSHLASHMESLAGERGKRT
jgi:hypothetical protein